MAVTNIMIVRGYHIPSLTPQLQTVVTGQLGAGWVPVGAPEPTDVYGECSQLLVKTDTGIVTTAYQLSKAASPSVPAVTGWEALGASVWVEAGTWLQAFTQGQQYGTTADLSNTVGTLPVVHGGTGANNATDARGNLVAARSGSNNDITGFAQRVSGIDPVLPQDLTTMQWVLNQIGGGGGPTLNGVMNFGVGMSYIADSRTFQQPYELPKDGQLVNRADWPDLWTYAQATGAITDATWLADPAQRGKYSTGNGTTTFRLPDWNGVQSGSIPGLFARGDQGGALPTGQVYQSAAPNLSGRIGAVSNDARGIFSSATGAFNINSADLVAGFTATAGGVTRYNYVYFDASQNNPVYGRATNQLYPNSVVGVWMVRASGGFTAANTLWSVINGDSVAPGPGVYVSGGTVRSDYNINGVRTSSMTFRSLMHDNITDGIIGLSNITTGISTEYIFRNNTVGGILVAAAPGQTNNWSDIKWLRQQQSTFLTADTNGPGGAGSVAFGFSSSHAVQADGTYGVQFASRASQAWFRNWENGVFQSWRLLTSTPVSDITLKNNVRQVSGEQSLLNIEALEMVTFFYNDDPDNTPRRGVIAQQAATVDPEYVHTYSADGVNMIMGLDTNVMLMDTLAAIKYLSAKVRALEAKG